MRILVTRPEPDGERTAGTLRARGATVLVAPLLRMALVEQADLGPGPWGAIAMTSANAARAIMQHPRLGELLALPVFTVGRRTAEAARAAGFSSVSSADGDQRDLARLIGAQHVGKLPLLYLAGEDRAGDLAAAVAGYGITTKTAVVYRAAQPTRFPPAVAAALMAGEVDGVLHFSRRSAEAFVACGKVAGLLDRALAPIQYCLSQAVAEPLSAAGAGRIAIAERPDEASLISLVVSL
jgi:uroporphyrinogen-III synthase